MSIKPSMSNNNNPSRITNQYRIDVLENNWSEDRFDVNHLKKHQPLRSDYNHYYETSYNKYENKFGPKNLNQEVVYCKKHRVNAFPGHQPEIDSNYYRDRTNIYQSEYRLHYMDPRIKKVPFELKQELANEFNKLEQSATTN